MAWDCPPALTFPVALTGKWIRVISEYYLMTNPAHVNFEGFVYCPEAWLSCYDLNLGSEVEGESIIHGESLSARFFVNIISEGNLPFQYPKKSFLSDWMKNPVFSGDSAEKPLSVFS